MRYRVYSGPPGSAAISPMEKDRLLYKEYATLDEALLRARHVNTHDGVALLIEGDDGTMMTRGEIAGALRHSESELQAPSVD